ncbi:hypothetical protein Droror1_Dr00016167 [Drosera rotundifolia]
MYNVWLNINDKIYGARTKASNVIARLSSKFHTEYRAANAKGECNRQQRINRTSSKWTTPPSGKLKINVDVSTRSPEVTSLGDIARDWEGKVRLAAGEHVFHDSEPQAGEAMTLRLGQELAREEGTNRIEIELDCKEPWAASGDDEQQRRWQLELGEQGQCEEELWVIASTRLNARKMRSKRSSGGGWLATRLAVRMVASGCGWRGEGGALWWRETAEAVEASRKGKSGKS